MACYEVTLGDRTTYLVEDADSYNQEGPLTTFYETGGRGVIDSWAQRVMSLRTSEILMVRRVDGLRPPEGLLEIA
ncbi:MAG TPA: hypothetical protein ENI86_06315 [Acidimicrobiales bacterium]|nr:hypothetical protein [Acidimicrobiales bacterium]